MKKPIALLLAITILSTFPAQAFAQGVGLHYPGAERGNISDTYFGTRVADPQQGRHARADDDRPP